MRKSFFLTLLLSIAGNYAHAGSVEFVTYYPAPYGVYDRVRLVPRAALGTPCDPGSMYVDNSAYTLRFCDATGNWGGIPDLLWKKSGSNLYPIDNTVSVGIGTTAPATALDVAKDVAPSSGVTELLTLRAYNLDGVANSASGDGMAINFRNRNNGSMVDIARISAILTQSGSPTYSGLTFSNYFLSTFPETMRIVNNKVGIGTTTPEFRLTLDKGSGSPDGGILAIGTLNSGNTLTTTGAGTRLIWYPRKAAFRAGYVDGTQWNDNLPNIGNYSVAMGRNTTASGSSSTAMGDGSTATGMWSTAMGRNTTASGSSSTAMGSNTAASGIRSTAMGAATAASGDYSTTMGFTTTAQAYASVVLGRYNVISGTTNSWVNTDPLFVIGNGTIGTPANALTVLKNGNIGIGPSAPGNKLHVTGGAIKATGGLIIQTSTTTPASPVDGQFWLCTDTGDVTPCNGI